MHKISSNTEKEGLRDMFIATLFFSFMSVFVKLVGERIPSQEIVLARNAFALLITYYALRKAKISPWGNNRKLLFLRGILGFFGLTCFFYALTHLPLGDATVIHFMNPVLTGILAAFFLKERAEKKTWIGGLLSIVGVVVMTRPSFLFASGRLEAQDVLIAMLGALFAAAAYVSVRALRKTEAPMVVVFYFPLVAFPASIPTAYSTFLWPTLSEWILLLIVGIMTQGGQVFMTNALHKTSAAKVTSISYLQIVFSFLWGMLFFNEHPDSLSLFGAAIIVSGILVANFRKQAK